MLRRFQRFSANFPALRPGEKNDTLENYHYRNTFVRFETSGRSREPFSFPRNEISLFRFDGANKIAKRNGRCSKYRGLSRRATVIIRAAWSKKMSQSFIEFYRERSGYTWRLIEIKHRLDV